MKRFIFASIVLLLLFYTPLFSCEEVVREESRKYINFALADFTHCGGYWKCVIADNTVFVTETVKNTAENENTFFFKVYPNRSGYTYLYFEFYAITDSETPWFYIEYVLEVDDNLSMAITSSELVPCLDNAYYE